MSERSLADLHIDEAGIVERVECEGGQLRRLFDLGIVEGTKIEALFKSPGGDPTAYFFRGTVIALRNSDAKKIILKN